MILRDTREPSPTHACVEGGVVGASLDGTAPQVASRHRDLDDIERTVAVSDRDELREVIADHLRAAAAMSDAPLPSPGGTVSGSTRSARRVRW